MTCLHVMTALYDREVEGCFGFKISKRRSFFLMMQPNGLQIRGAVDAYALALCCE